MKTINPYELDHITRAYLECALWSSTHQDTEEPLDENYSIEDFSQSAIQTSIDYCNEFHEKTKHLTIGIPLDDIGHNFWLTRNRHGTGFWDRGYEHGEELTKIAHTFVELDIFVDENNELSF